MQRYGREIGYDFQDKETNIVCRPRQDQPPVPITFLRQYIAERAVQSLMMPLTKEEGKYVTLKYEGEAIWHGHLGEDFQVTPIVNATSQAYKPIIGDAEMRLVYKGATMWEPTSLSAFCATRNIDEEQRMTIHLIPSMRGGVAAKQAQVTRVKNAVATTLMQTGYDLGFVTKVVDQLTQKYGIPKLDALMQSNVNQQGPMLQKIGQEIGIQFPVQVQEAIPTVFKKRRLPQPGQHPSDSGTSHQTPNHGVQPANTGTGGRVAPGQHHDLRGRARAGDPRDTHTPDHPEGKGAGSPSKRHDRTRGAASGNPGPTRRQRAQAPTGPQPRRPERTGGGDSMDQLAG